MGCSYERTEEEQEAYELNIRINKAVEVLLERVFKSVAQTPDEILAAEKIARKLWWKVL